MKKQKTEKETLKLSIILSSFGPLITGINLISGRSTTQIADFSRRSAELLGMIASYLTFIKSGNIDEAEKIKKERKSNTFVGLMMCFAAIIMIILSFYPTKEKGNVLPSLFIALMGVFVNSKFWIKYKKLNEINPNSIIQVQANLYRAKTFIDICVSLVLLSIITFPYSRISYFFDIFGSLCVSVYLLNVGVRTLIENKK